MERTKNQYTIKVSKPAVDLLRKIAEHTGELQYRLVYRLLTREWDRLQREAKRQE